jgi:acetyl/propionyl-CoA carboxylase alpha subunit
VVALWRPPEGDGVRVDAGVETGDTISPWYDPLVAKISAHGASRDEALRRLDNALRQTVLFGVRSNLDYVRRVLLHPDHRAGRISTAFLDQHAADLLAAEPDTLGDGLTPVQLAALAITLQRLGETPIPTTWRNNRSRPLLEVYKQAPAKAASSDVRLALTPQRAGWYSVAFGADGEEGQAYSVRVRERQGPDIWLEIAGHALRMVALEAQPEEWWARVAGETIRLLRQPPLPAPGAARASNDALTAPMPGQVIAVLVAEGQAVTAGAPLMILEAMKMEHTIRAPHDGVVAAIHYRPGDQVRAAAVLLDVRATTAAER